MDTANLGITSCNIPSHDSSYPAWLTLCHNQIYNKLINIMTTAHMVGISSVYLLSHIVVVIDIMLNIFRTSKLIRGHVISFACRS